MIIKIYRTNRMALLVEWQSGIISEVIMGGQREELEDSVCDQR